MTCYDVCLATLGGQRPCDDRFGSWLPGMIIGFVIKWGFPAAHPMTPAALRKLWQWMQNIIIICNDSAMNGELVDSATPATASGDSSVMK